MKNVRKLKRHKFRGLKKIIFIIIILAAGYYLVFEAFQIHQFVIEGSERYTEEEMKSYLGTDKLDQNSLYFYLKYKYKDTPDIPFIQNVDVKFVDKNTIALKLYEKVVTGCVEFMGEFMYFDKDGIVVETSQEREEDIPLVVGLKFTRIALHEQLKIQKSSMYDTILALTKLIRKYELPVDIIAFDSDYEVTLTCGKSKVLLGKHDFYDIPLSQLHNILEASNGVPYNYDLRNYTEVGQDFIADKLE